MSTKEMEDLFDKCIEMDGLSNQIYTNTKKFQNCPACSTKFSRAKLPVLLICGHLLSDDTCIKSVT